MKHCIIHFSIYDDIVNKNNIQVMNAGRISFRYYDIGYLQFVALMFKGSNLAWRLVELNDTDALVLLLKYDHRVILLSDAEFISKLIDIERYKLALHAL